jgi:hypothetical protein
MDRDQQITRYSSFLNHSLEHLSNANGRIVLDLHTLNYSVLTVRHPRN